MTLLVTSCSLFPISSSNDNDDPINNVPAEETPETEDEEEEIEEEVTPVIDTTQPNNAALKNSNDYYKLFDPSTEIAIEVSLSDAASQVMSYYQGRNDYTKWKDFYLPGDFKITIDDHEYFYEEVGVRMKGNTSRRQFLGYGNNIEQLVNLKISFKATFDDANYLLEEDFAPFHKTWDDAEAKSERKDRNLFGLEKLDLKIVPRNDGKCIVTDVYANDVFRNNGIIAPRANLASFTFKNDSSSSDGEVELVEPIDKQMLKRYFSKDDSKGDLYKCVYKTMGKADLSRPRRYNSSSNPSTHHRFEEGIWLHCHLHHS